DAYEALDRRLEFFLNDSKNLARSRSKILLNNSKLKMKRAYPDLADADMEWPSQSLQDQRKKHSAFRSWKYLNTTLPPPHPHPSCVQNHSKFQVLGIPRQIKNFGNNSFLIDRHSIHSTGDVEKKSSNEIPPEPTISVRALGQRVRNASTPRAPRNRPLFT